MANLQKYSKIPLLTNLLLPLPPSVNNYLVRGRNGVRLSDKARAYKQASYLAIKPYAPSQPVTTRLAGVFTICPATRARFDLDNKMKLVLDSLQAAGFFVDDSQFDELLISRGSIVKGGQVVVDLFELKYD